MANWRPVKRRGRRIGRCQGCKDVSNIPRSTINALEGAITVARGAICFLGGVMFVPEGAVNVAGGAMVVLAGMDTHSGCTVFSGLGI